MPENRFSLDINIVQTMKELITREENKSRYFFIRRIPKFNLPREWDKPPEELYKDMLLKEGFVTEKLLGQAMSDKLARDIWGLEVHLMPHFWRMDQKAKFFQNRYYLYQWIFILAAFFTTAFAAINVFLYAQDWNTLNTGSFIDSVPLTEVLGALTAVISGIAAAVSYLDANQAPQKRWFKARAQAESLRSFYFLFLARQKPFNIVDNRARIQIMRQNVIDVLRDTRHKGSDQ